MTLDQAADRELLKPVTNPIQYADVTINNIYSVKPTNGGIERLGLSCTLQSGKKKTLYCLNNQFKNAPTSCENGIKATVAYRDTTWTDKTGTTVEDIQVVQIVAHIITAEKEAEIKAAKAYTVAVAL